MENFRCELWVYSKCPFVCGGENTVLFGDGSRSNINEENRKRFYNSNLFKLIYHTKKASQRPENGAFTVEGAISDYIFSTYIRFKNKKINDIFYYAFVTDVFYLQDNLVQITYELDLLQTFQQEIIENVEGHIERAHSNFYIKNNDTQEYNILPYPQGFNTGRKNIVRSAPFQESGSGGVNINWLVWGYLPNVSLYEGDINKGRPSYISYPSGLRFCILPFNPSTNQSYSFQYKNITCPVMNISDVEKFASNMFSEGGNVNTVGQVMIHYTSKAVGIEFEYISATNIIKIIDNENQLFAVANIGGSGISIIEVVSINKFKSVKHPIFNIVGGVYYEISRILTSIYPDKSIEIEPQLVHSEFAEIELTDYTGNSYIYKPEYINQKDHDIIIRGSVNDTNIVHYSLDDYSVLDSYIEGESGNTPAQFEHGIRDVASRQQIIINDSSALYYQAMYNQIAAQKVSFSENRDITEMTINNSANQVALNNQYNDYTAQYNYDVAAYNQGNAIPQGIINTVAGIIGGAGVGTMVKGRIGGNLGAIGGGFNGVIGGIDNYMTTKRELINAENQQKFTSADNNLKTQAQTISAIGARTANNQALRQLNATIKDFSNQPASYKAGTLDLVKYNSGYNMAAIFVNVKIAHPQILLIANNYIKYFGVRQNGRYCKIKDLVKIRNNYNYTQFSTIYLRNNYFNLSHLNSLKSHLNSGVRWWNYNQNIDRNYQSQDIDNYDKI